MHFDVAFLLKFRRFNSAEHLNLRELLAGSEFSKPLNDVAWDYILENPSKLLLLFDGIDEFSAKTKIAKDDSYHGNTAEEKMPLHALYSKIASGKLLHGATVISTTRPTAASCVRGFRFNRTVEILGFTSNQVEDYVEKFTEDDKDAGKTIWQHISSNLNLFFVVLCSCEHLYNLLVLATYPKKACIKFSRPSYKAHPYIQFRHKTFLLQTQ